MAAPAQRFYTVEEYFAIEEASDIRHEYYAGRIYAMAGGTQWHDVLTGDLTLAVGNRLTGGCRFFTANMRVKVGEYYVYPDLSIACGAQFEQGGGTTLLNPVVLVEVLSPSTEKYDRGGKWELYQTIESLTDYVLIAQEKMRVEHYVRQPNNQWLLSSYNQPDDLLRLPAVGFEISLEKLYANVEFPPEATGGMVRPLDDYQRS